MSGLDWSDFARPSVAALGVQIAYSGRQEARIEPEAAKSTQSRRRQVNSDRAV